MNTTTKPKQAEILFISGSPRAHTSEALLALIERGAREAGARSKRFLLSKKHIAPCRGCGHCEKTGSCILADPTAETSLSDDYLELLDALEHADALAIISPVYFAGPPAQLKALLDRMQPFWARKYVLGQESPEKRPAQIFIVGGGGDSHGYDPLVTIARSSLAVAGFSLEKIQNFIGFKPSNEVAPFPTEDEAERLAFGELAQLRKAAAKQREFEQRAVSAGAAFARIVGKSMQKLELQAELQQIEEEIAELTADKPPLQPSGGIPPSFEAIGSHEPIQIVDHVDSDFEALKKTARAAKSSQAEKAVAQAKEGYLSGASKEADANSEDEALSSEVDAGATSTDGSPSVSNASSEK